MSIAQCHNAGAGENFRLLIRYERSDAGFDPCTRQEGGITIGIAPGVAGKGYRISIAAERLEREQAAGVSFERARSAAWTAALNPQINALFAVGIVSLPGMMTGQILSGVDPLIAGRHQIVVMRRRPPTRAASCDAIERACAGRTGHQRTFYGQTNSGSGNLGSKFCRWTGAANLRRTVPSYVRDIDYNRIKSGFTALLYESANGLPSWTDALDGYLGIGQMPLITAHKSKGLEFHTLFFLGLDGQSWWSLRPNSEEELKSFSVAFTNAMQRAFFTRCNERDGSIA